MIKDKIMSKSGASDMVVVLIMIVIFAAVALLVFKGIGGSVKTAGTKAQTSIADASTP